MAEALQIVGDIARLSLAPGDVVVVRCSRDIDREHAVQLRDMVRNIVKGHDVMVLDASRSISVIAREDRMERIEAIVEDTSAKLDRLLLALADEEDEQPRRSLDGEDAGGERDQSQSL